MAKIGETGHIRKPADGFFSLAPHSPDRVVTRSPAPDGRKKTAARIPAPVPRVADPTRGILGILCENPAAL